MMLFLSVIVGILGAILLTCASIGVMFLVFVATDNIDLALIVFGVCILASIGFSAWLAKGRD
jgi:uncharacterized protein with PQ loop repeat